MVSKDDLELIEKLRKKISVMQNYTTGKTLLDNYKLYFEALSDANLEFSPNDIEDIIIKSANFLITNDQKDFSITDKVDYLKDLGLNTEEIKNVIKESPTIIELTMDANDSSSIPAKIGYLKELGLEKDEIYKMIKMMPTVLSYSIEEKMQRGKLSQISYLQKLGFGKKEIVKMLKNIVSQEKTDNLKLKIQYLVHLGFKKTEIHKILKENPYYLVENLHDIIEKEIYLNRSGLNTQNIKQVVDNDSFYLTNLLENIQDIIKYMDDYGFKNKIKIFTESEILAHGPDFIKDTVEFLEKKYTKVDVIKIIQEYPLILGIDDESMFKYIE